MRLIDGDKLNSEMYHEAFETDSPLQKWDSGCWIRYKMFENHLKEAPTVDAAPVVHGRWQWLSSTYDRIPCEMRYMCDKCRHETITHGHEPWEKYCPNCGAKMDLEEQHEQIEQPGK